MKKYFVSLIACLSLAQGAIAGVEGGGGGPPPAMIAISREDFLNVYKALIEEQDGIDISVKGRAIRVEKFDFPQQQIKGKDLKTRENLALKSLNIPAEYLETAKEGFDIPAIEIIK